MTWTSPEYYLDIKFLKYPLNNNWFKNNTHLLFEMLNIPDLKFGRQVVEEEQLERKSPGDNPRELGNPGSNACLLLSSISFSTVFTSHSDCY